MGFSFKNIFRSFTTKDPGKKALTNNPYLGYIIDADEDNVIADELFWVGMSYYQGAYKLPQDNVKAMEYFRKAADRGHAVAQTFMAMGCMNFHDDHNKEVMSWMQKAAKQGERQAAYNLGISYHRGDIDGKVDIQKSNELFRLSAEAGYQPAYSRMALIYYNGDGVEKNDKIAKYWAWLDYSSIPEEARKNAILLILLDKNDADVNNHINFKKIIEDAAEAGERDAMDNWASGLFEVGEKEKAIELWKKAAKLHHPNALVNLGRQLWTKKVQDYDSARKLFEEASETGNEYAFYALAVIYHQGLGVEKDVAKGWGYLEKAINMGNSEARHLFASMIMQKEYDTILPYDEKLPVRGMRMHHYNNM